MAFRDLPLLLSIIMITLALLCFEVYSVFLILQGYNFGQIIYINSNEFVNILRMIDFTKVVLTFSAFVFDLYKWGLFINATSTEVLEREDKA